MGQRLMLVLGGAHSGKRAFARQQAATWGEHVLYVATNQPDLVEALPAGGPQDIPETWRLLEAPHDPAAAIMSEMWGHDVIVLEDLSLLTTNLLLRTEEADMNSDDALARILKQMNALIAAYAASQAAWVVVSHEVGMGVVPRSRLGRHYRQALGRVNQRWAGAADDVIFMLAGLPWRLTPYAP
ncbi:MAG: bifunctional adenosylcobinamide kinase/adenosylcobinamide-phosphate guanylyltransferase [Anaerolineales bacterium]